MVNKEEIVSSHDVNDYFEGKIREVKAYVYDKVCIVGRMGDNTDAKLYLDVYPLNYGELNTKAQQIIDEQKGTEIYSAEYAYDDYIKSVCGAQSKVDSPV